MDGMARVRWLVERSVLYFINYAILMYLNGENVSREPPTGRQEGDRSVSLAANVAAGLERYGDFGQTIQIRPTADTVTS